MKKIIYSVLIGLTLLFNTTSCEKEVKDLSKVTYFVDLQLKGEKQMWIELNSSFEDPGFTATENDEDVSSKVEVSGSVETDKVGYYVLNYTVANADGFTTSASREVFVYDNSVTEDYTGTYTVAGTRTYQGADESFEGYTVEVTKIQPGFYVISDFLGGYYSQGRGYGESYNLTGYASIDTEGQLTGLYSYIPGWGDSASSITGSVNDYEVISMTVEYAGMKFVYTLTKEGE